MPPNVRRRVVSLPAAGSPENAAVSPAHMLADAFPATGNEARPEILVTAAGVRRRLRGDALGDAISARDDAPHVLSCMPSVV
jgi:hypothetical protein